MNNFFKITIYLSFLFSGFACKSLAGSEQLNVEEFLLEAKECLDTVGSQSFDRMKVPSYLQKHLEQINARDYVEHTFLGSKLVAISFRKSQNGRFFAISLYFELDKDKGCRRISIYEILG